MHCPACDSPIPLAAGESIGFRETCDRCGADLHVCRSCAHFDPTVYNECREPMADRVLDRERANRCEYFRPSDRRGGDESERSAALDRLEGLFKKE